MVIADLGLAVALRVAWHRKSMGNLILSTVNGYLLTGEIYPIIRDDSVREAEATHNVLPQELDYLLSCYFEKKHNFDPFGEVVGVNQ